MARAWLINSRGIAKKVRNATCYMNNQIRDLGTEIHRECPNCKYIIDNSDVSLEWPGLPAGVKFDPTDAELLEHLAGKAGLGTAQAHIFIDEFIPTLDGDEGLCYTHPENLPGARKDGSSVHFFHRTLNAYSTGRRKRRKINTECSESEEQVRWHKTGKTKPIMLNGVLKGWKKIMVLYRSSGKHCKPGKANWVVHQYHLGADEEEKDCELVVSKIFYQQTKHIDKIDTTQVPQELDALGIRNGPRTPNTMTPVPPRSKTDPYIEADEVGSTLLAVQENHGPEVELPSSPLPVVCLKDEDVSSNWWPGESQALEEEDPQKTDDSLLCHEVLDSFPSIGESSTQVQYTYITSDSRNHFDGDANASYAFPTVENIEVDTLPDFQLSDLQFGSQDSIMSWLDRL
ncbi:hypothetical protein HPP92_024274 [Vanilla planifolia]|uniref:NAC domain-containing protein n=1 Tax=Vanilla planifolia TaxID=51239 RepID=A0A835PNX4_VANPL|nr:hypothetical protein HPP92_024274 [Vanilla planifolia]